MKAATLKMRRWRKKNKKQNLENDRRWRRENIEKAKANNRAWYSRNRQQELKRNAAYLKKTAKQVNQRVRLRRHNLTQEQHEVKIAEQNNCCAICRKIFDRTPNIDHNHACCPKLRSCEKCRRGLLCSACNVMIGMAQESIEVLSNAIQYLKGYQK